ncbi:MAG: cadherin-like domain-containing protein, partial [Methyloglobulus sp.]|nr:cadherin-like domain-containing protein [Methyloglobulus sp.]
TATLTLATATDSALEGAETVIASLNAATISGEPAGAPQLTLLDGSGTGTITDTTALTVSISDAATVNEGGDLVYTVTLSGTSTTDITVPVTYTGTAADGSDYTSVASVTILAGETTATLTLATATDSALEGAETVIASLNAATISGEPAGAPQLTLLDGSGTGTINDIDLTPPTITVSAPDNTNDSTPTITGTTDLPAGSVVTVTVTDSAGNAQALTAVVQPGGTYSVDVPAPLAEGNYSATATGADTAGNSATVSDPGSIITLPPIASPDKGIGIEDRPVKGNLLDNDHDPEGKPLTVTQFTVNGITALAGDTVSIPNVGKFTLDAQGNYIFTPVKDFHGILPLVGYTVSDGGKTTNSTLTVTVKPVNDPPVANDDFIIHFSPVSGSVFGNDKDPDGDLITLTEFTIEGIVGTFAAGSTVNIPGIGVLVLNSNGNFTFTPNPGFSGHVPLIEYFITDGHLVSSAILEFQHERNPTSLGNIGALIQLSNPTPPLFPVESGGGYSLLPFRAPNNTWSSTQPYSPSRLSLYGDLQDYDLYLTGSLRNQVVQEMHHYSFSIPAGTFRHSNPNEQLEYEASQVDGSPLPNWLHFDPKQLKFTGVPPKGSINTEVMVKARDRYGNEAYATFRVVVKKEHDYSNEDKFKIGHKRVQHKPDHHAQEGLKANQATANMSVKLGFNEQLSGEGKLGRLMESRALLDSLSQL